jgi:hypothetical protein
MMFKTLAICCGCREIRSPGAAAAIFEQNRTARFWVTQLQ